MTTRRFTVPAGVPVPARYAHLDPSSGGCLMEIVSVLAGERFSDAPRCTHPVLALVARLVNDVIGDPATLLPLAPSLVGVYPTDRRVTAAVVARCAAAALAVAPGRRRVRADLRRALHRHDRLAASPARRYRVLDVLYLRGPATHAVARAVRVLSDHARYPDAALRELLGACLRDARAYSGPPPVADLSTVDTRLSGIGSVARHGG